MMRLVSFATLFALLLVLGCKKVPPPPPPPSTPAAVVKATDLMKEYSANALAADAKYKGKLIQVTGKFASASKVILKGYAATVVPEDADLNLSGVQCFLLETAEPEVAKFQPGQMITIQGTCDGQVLAQVTMSRCSVVK